MVANVGCGRKEMTNGIYGHKLRDKDDRVGKFKTQSCTCIDKSC